MNLAVSYILLNMTGTVTLSSLLPRVKVNLARDERIHIWRMVTCKTHYIIASLYVSVLRKNSRNYFSFQWWDYNKVCALQLQGMEEGMREGVKNIYARDQVLPWLVGKMLPSLLDGFRWFKICTVRIRKMEIQTTRIVYLKISPTYRAPFVQRQESEIQKDYSKVVSLYVGNSGKLTCNHKEQFSIRYIKPSIFYLFWKKKHFKKMYTESKSNDYGQWILVLHFL